MKIHIKLSQILDQRGISHRKFAQMTGIRHPSISAYCNNEVKHMPLDSLAIICKTLDCQITDILQLVNDETEENT